MSDTLWTGTSSTVYGTSGNWLGGSAATTGDTASFDGRAVNALAGSNQSAITLAVLTQYSSMAQAIGSSAAMLQIGATLYSLGVTPDDGSNRTPAEVALNFGSAQSTGTIYSTATSGTANLPPVLLKGSHASNKCTIISGQVGWGCETPGSTYALATCNIIGNGAYVVLESGGTLTNVNQDDGFALIKAAFGSGGTITQIGGIIEIWGSGTIATATIGGTFRHRGTRTISNLIVNSGGFADFSGLFDAMTVTNAKVYGSGRIFDPNKRVTWSTPIQTFDGAQSSQIQIGNGVTIQPA